MPVKSTYRALDDGAPRRVEHGFSLVEVLVAMLVLAIGLLGLAALQTQGVRFNHDAFVRTQATSLAYDIIDKMRINRTNAANYTTANFPVAPFVCNPAAATVANDLACWLSVVTTTLPAGNATIAQQAAPNNNLFDITIQWLDREPREFGGVLRAPQNQAECEAPANRLWSGGQCLVTQTWSVMP